jgi:hypothetical protein
VSPLPVDLIAEGPLDEQVLRQLVLQSAPHLQAGVCFGKKGRDWLQANLPKYNQAAQSRPFVTLADLEQDECPPTLLQLWFPRGIHPNMRPRLAVRMVESWLLADRESLARFLGIALHHIPQWPDDEANPKQFMVNLARRSRFRTIRDEMVPPQNTPGRVGRNYRGQLERFVLQFWSAERAQTYSPSLQRAIRSLQEFHPVIPGYGHAS